MHPFFSVTLFTGQQLVLEAIQRWLQRPCADEAAARQRRVGLKGLVSLLLRTAATGVLATVLDAAIEFRRRQLLAAVADPADGDAAAGASRFPGFGMLSRSGVAAWKQRLLLGIDELERRAEAYGIESRHRFSPGKEGADAATAKAASASVGDLAATCGDLGAACACGKEGEEEGPGQRLSRTVEQLRELVNQGDPESERRLDEEVGSLVDLILGTAPPSPAPASPAYGASAAGLRSYSVPARLDRLGGGAAAGGEQPHAGCCQGPGSPCASDLCQICMDRPVRVQVAECRHELCFGCARRLCASQDHAVPQCPFDRLPINGFLSLASGRVCDGSGAPDAAEPGAAALAAS